MRTTRTNYEDTATLDYGVDVIDLASPNVIYESYPVQVTVGAGWDDDHGWGGVSEVRWLLDRETLYRYAAEFGIPRDRAGFAVSDNPDRRPSERVLPPTPLHDYYEGDVEDAVLEHARREVEGE